MSSDKCAGCDCTDSSQCTKKEYSAEIIETETSYTETVVLVEATAAEHNGKCKCGSSCACIDCTCGH